MDSTSLEFEGRSQRLRRVPLALPQPSASRELPSCDGSDRSTRSKGLPSCAFDAWAPAATGRRNPLQRVERRNHETTHPPHLAATLAVVAFSTALYGAVLLVGGLALGSPGAAAAASPLHAVASATGSGQGQDVTLLAAERGIVGQIVIDQISGGPGLPSSATTVDPDGSKAQQIGPGGDTI